MTATEYPEANRVVEAIRAAWPEEAALIDADMSRCGYENAPHAWIERFSQFTTNAIGRGEFSTATRQLLLLSQLLAAGDEETAKCIDVAYVESLMWDVKDPEMKREGWKLMPENLRALYLQMWGKRAFMK
jgi:hypothetical protein